MSTHPKNVIVVGAGIIGLACSWRLARAGHHVTLIDKDHPGRGASWAAAGMLAPVTELGFEDPHTFALAQRSLKSYPHFLADLAADAGVTVELEQTGTLVAALDRDQSQAIRRQLEFRQELGLDVDWLDGDSARDREPLLSPRVTGAMWIPDDHHIDNRRLIEALVAGTDQRGVTRITDEVVEVNNKSTAGIAVRTTNGTLDADTAVLCTGVSDRVITCDVPLPTTRPVKGQIISVAQSPEFPLRHVVRTPQVYLVPKADRVLIGATQEEVGFDVRATAGAALHLLEHAWEVVPAIYELEILSIDVGLRPATRDNAPVIGSLTPNLLVASGHYRHGILLAPVTANAITELINAGDADPVVARFHPSRFTSEPTHETHR